MNHRHINSSKELSSVAINDIIGRGSLADWGELNVVHRGRGCLMPKFAFYPLPLDYSLKYRIPECGFSDAEGFRARALRCL